MVQLKVPWLELEHDLKWRDELSDIKVVNKITQEQLEVVEKWSIWEKEISTFPWSYDEMETCYFLEGDVVVTPKGGEPVTMGKGDLVTFPAGMSCTWQINKPVRKHFIFGSTL
ncbi:MAG: cupin domain-containing protein [Magnetococcales bacterium]|nr:cupin domain-containing protein [Magnetococcales bacterium]